MYVQYYVCTVHTISPFRSSIPNTTFNLRGDRTEEGPEVAIDSDALVSFSWASNPEWLDELEVIVS
jgi:hypothetical protein